MNLVEQHIDAIKQLCKKYNVEALYVFGSVLTEQFHQDSDIDFLVKFQVISPSLYFDNYCDFKSSLEDALKKKVDLIEEQAIKNPLLKKSINKTKKLIYGRADSKVAA